MKIMYGECRLYSLATLSGKGSLFLSATKCGQSSAVVSSPPSSHVLSSAVRVRGEKGFQSSGNSLRFEHGGLGIFPRVRLEQEPKLIQNKDKVAYRPKGALCMQQNCFCCESILVSLLTCKTLEVVFDTSEQSCPNLATCKIILGNFLTLSRLHRQTRRSIPLHLWTPKSET